MGYICEARREPVVEFWRDIGAVVEFWRDSGAVVEFVRESEPVAGCVLDGLLVTLGRGETGTELRSGAMVDCPCPFLAFASVFSARAVLES
jgi:hypothetical protein